MFPISILPSDLSSSGVVNSIVPLATFNFDVLLSFKFIIQLSTFDGSISSSETSAITDFSIVTNTCVLWTILSPSFMFIVTILFVPTSPVGIS